MSIPAIISSRSPMPDRPAPRKAKDSQARAPRRRLSDTTMAVLAGLVFAGLRVAAELRQAVEPVFAVGRAIIIGSSSGSLLGERAAKGRA